MICIAKLVPSFSCWWWWVSMAIRVSAWELPVGQYWILRCQHGAFHWEGQFHPPWGLIAGIRGRKGGRGQNEN